MSLARVLTRREQLAKAVPDPDGKIAAAKAKAKAKAKARAKAKAKAKSKAKSPKVKPSPGRKRAVRAKAKAAAAPAVDPEPEVPTPAYNPNHEVVAAERAEVPEIDTPKRRLFNEQKQGEIEKKPKAPRAPRGKASAKSKGSAKGSGGGSGGSDGPADLPAPMPAPAGHGKGRGRGRGKGRGKGIEQGDANAALACPEMESIILEQLRVTEGKPFDDVKNYLNSKNGPKGGLSQTKGVLSVYWTRSATGVKLKLGEDEKFGCPQVAYFAFRAAPGTQDVWNKQITCSFWAGILLDLCLSVNQFVLSLSCQLISPIHLDICCVILFETFYTQLYNCMGIGWPMQRYVRFIFFDQT